MSNDSKNEGIIQQGGEIHAVQLTVGKGASATNIMTTLRETLDQKGLKKYQTNLIT